MIKATELRVGNWVLITGQKIKLEGAKLAFIFEQDGLITRCEPIPITPEILEKAGFEKDRHGWLLPNTQFSLTDNLFPCWLDRMLWPGGIPDFDNIQLKYLHQLQNLYFALTGAELNYGA